MTQRIVSIEDVYDDPKGYDGYRVTLEGGNDFTIAVSNGTSCCENWGMITVPQAEINHFIGSQIRGIVPIRLQYKEGDSQGYGDDGGTAFVDVLTDRGVLQLAVYNYHNGYYGHGVVLFHNGHRVDEGGL